MSGASTSLLPQGCRRRQHWVAQRRVPSHNVVRVSLLLFFSFLLCSHNVLTSHATDPTPTPSPPDSNFYQYYGSNVIGQHPWEYIVISIVMILCAIAAEYFFQWLKQITGTYFQIVMQSVQQETLVVGIVSLGLITVITSFRVSDLFAQLLRFIVVDLVIIVILFLGVIAIITGGLLLNRRQWRQFERSRMEADLAEDPIAINAASSPSLSPQQQRAKTGSSSTAPVPLSGSSVPGKPHTATEPPPNRGSSTRDVEGEKKSKFSLVQPNQMKQKVRETVLLQAASGGGGGEMVVMTGDNGELLPMSSLSGGGPKRRAPFVMPKRRLLHFSRQERIYTLARDLFFQTLHERDLPAPRGMLFTDYLWQLMPNIVSLFADLSWKAWLLLSLFVVIDGVRGVIVLGDVATEVSTTDDTVVGTTYGSLIFLGGCVPFILYVVMHQNLLIAADHVTSKRSIMKQHVRAAQAHMVQPSDRLFFKRVDATCQILQIVLLVFVWYTSLFILAFVRFAFVFYSGPGLLIVLGGLIPFTLFLWFMPWTLTLVAILSGLGLDLQPSVVEKVDAELRQSRGELTANQQRRLTEAVDQVAGEWVTEQPLQIADANPNGRSNRARLRRQQREESERARANTTAGETAAGDDKEQDDKHRDGPKAKATAKGKTGADEAYDSEEDEAEGRLRDRELRSAMVRLKPAPPVLPPLLRPNFLFESEREYFSRFDRQEVRQLHVSSSSGSDEDL